MFKTSAKPFLGVFGDGSRGVDLFFVLSGFVITYIHCGDWGRPGRVPDYLFKRLGRIYPSVWVVTGLALVVYASGFGGAGGAAKITPWNVVATALLLPQWDVSLVNVTWTLKYEMFFYLVFALSIIERRTGLIVLGLWQAGVLAVALSGTSYLHLLGGNVAAFYLRPICLEFGIGVVSALLLMRGGGLPPVSAAFQWAGLLGGGAAFAAAMLFETYAGPAKLPDLVFGASAGLIVTALVMLESAGHIRVGSRLAALGDASYSIYLVHFSVITLAFAAATRLHHMPRGDLAYLAVALIAVGMGVAFDRVVDRPLRRRLRRARVELSSGWRVRELTESVGASASP
jgi:peptidoglycan/LPS O-acetylase OafA/YrhL